MGTIELMSGMKVPIRIAMIIELREGMIEEPPLESGNSTTPITQSIGTLKRNPKITAGNTSIAISIK